MNMRECIAYIENQIPQKIDLSLKRMEQAAHILGNPEKKFKSIHITGTNGKGSTSAFTAQLLEKQGLKVGLFTSPHLISYNERIRINNVEISDTEFSKLIECLIQNVFPLVQLTIFETLTLVGYLYFAEQNVDIAVIEVGLGGRFDATNIITPTVSCVTNISLDHIHFLSDDIKKIAAEKAGIFKKESCNLYAVEEIELQKIMTEENNATFIKPFIKYTSLASGFDIAFELNNQKYHCHFPMYGLHQIRNLETAITIVKHYFLLEKQELVSELLCEQIQHLTWKGRMEQLQDCVFFDGAHNIAGVESLNQTIKTHFSDKKVTIVFSVMADKDYSKMLEIFKNQSNIKQLYFLALPYERALKELPRDVVSGTQILQIAPEQIAHVVSENEITIFAGSLYGYAFVKELLK